MNANTLLVVILILFLIGALPAWGIHEYGYYPSAGVGFVLLVVLVLLLIGKL